MKFRVVQASTWETLEIIEKKDLTEACMYMSKWYGEDSDTDIEYVERNNNEQMFQLWIYVE